MRGMIRRAAGLGLGAATVLGLGCRSSDPIPYPPRGERAAASRELASRERKRPEQAPVGGALAPVAYTPGSPETTDPSPAAAIDLEAALRLAGADNPTVNLAREQVREALAGLLAARALLLPSINIGGNFYLHRGTLQSTPGQMRDVDRQSLYLGFGGRTVGAGPVAFPGVWLFAHLGDAVYEPLAARQRVAAVRSDSRAVNNAVLLEVATAYLELAGAGGRLDVLRRGEIELAEVVRLTQVYAEKGQGRQADAHRAAANADLLRRQIREAEEDVAVASARLCRLLNLDPSVRLRPPAGAIEPLRLIPEDSDTEPLVAEAVRSRPELFARSAEILEAQTRVRQERVRPWVPTVSVGYSGGLFGGGSNLAPSEFGPLKGRSDFDAVAVWNMQNLGLGNRARVRGADAVVGQAVAGYDLAVNQVRQEVAAALADARAAARQVETARAALAAAEEGFRLESERIRQAIDLSRPIEVLDSFRQLLEVRQELVRAMVAFDVAQFRLFVAVGNAPGR